MLHNGPCPAEAASVQSVSPKYGPETERNVRHFDQSRQNPIGPSPGAQLYPSKLGVPQQTVKIFHFQLILFKLSNICF